MNKTIPMDWTAEDIKNNAFTYYELDNDSRSLSGYHVYTRCAFEGYKEMDETTKLTYIMATHSLNDDGIVEEEDIADLIDSSDFQAVKVIRGFWRKMSENLRQAWKERAAVVCSLCCSFHSCVQNPSMKLNTPILFCLLQMTLAHSECPSNLSDVLPFLTLLNIRLVIPGCVLRSCSLSISTPRLLRGRIIIATDGSQRHRKGGSTIIIQDISRKYFLYRFPIGGLGRTGFRPPCREVIINHTDSRASPRGGVPEPSASSLRWVEQRNERIVGTSLTYPRD